ncbi:hypothetical protein [Kitasatospora sp. NPDC005856]|uniref:hypothetical protein n=1 Tax=Kitasatospora sp. NPDC005856 TaxID=3154566 RepID=UPI0033F2194A
MTTRYIDAASPSSRPTNSQLSGDNLRLTPPDLPQPAHQQGGLPKTSPRAPP